MGIKFCADESEISKYKVNAKAKAKLTYCQHLAMARGGHKAMYMPANMLLCENAEPVFGFRELDKEKDTKTAPEISAQRGTGLAGAPGKSQTSPRKMLRHLYRTPGHV